MIDVQFINTTGRCVNSKVSSQLSVPTSDHFITLKILTNVFLTTSAVINVNNYGITQG